MNIYVNVEVLACCWLLPVVKLASLIIVIYQVM